MGRFVTVARRLPKIHDIDLVQDVRHVSSSSPPAAIAAAAATLFLNSKLSERDPTEIAPEGLAVNVVDSVDDIPEGFTSTFNPGTLSEVQDNRTFHPEIGMPLATPLRSSRRWMAPVTISKKAAVSYGYAPNAVRAPSAVALCIRRYARRRAIFATGNSGGGHKPPRRNAQSDIKC